MFITVILIVKLFAFLLFFGGCFANPCPCLVCRDIALTEEHTRKHMFTRSTGDGIGSVITNIIYGSAIADTLGLEYAGAFQQGDKNLKKHNAKSTDVLDFVFGDNTLVRPHYPPYWIPAVLNDHWCVIPVKKDDPWPWERDSAVMTDSVLQEWKERTLLSSSNGYYFETHRFNPMPQHMNYFVTQSYLAKLRKTSFCAMGVNATVDKTTEPVVVVAHFRLGDMDIRSKSTYMKQFKSYLSPEERYFLLFDAIRKIFKGNVKCLAFTSCVTAEHCKILEEVDVPLWKSHGISLTVDDEKQANADIVTNDVIRTIKLMATADIFLTAKSSLSHAGGLLNPNCVIDDPHFHHNPLPSWIFIKEDKNTSKVDLVGEDHSQPLVTQLHHALKVNGCLGTNLPPILPI